jgi:hypothetical protein
VMVPKVGPVATASEETLTVIKRSEVSKFDDYRDYLQILRYDFFIVVPIVLCRRTRLTAFHLQSIIMSLGLHEQIWKMIIKILCTVASFAILIRGIETLRR